MLLPVPSIVIVSLPPEVEPTEEVHFQAYSSVVQAMSGKLRTPPITSWDNDLSHLAHWYREG